MAKTMKKQWTEADVFRLLEKRYAGDAVALLSQVADGTGMNKCRTADVVAVSCWPSRGLYMTGIEIKVSASDFRKELQQPNKSESIQRYCRYWYVAAPKGVIDVALLPESWGLIECTTNRTLTTKVAPTLKEQPVDMDLLCSILRNASAASVPRQLYVAATTGVEERILKQVAKEMVDVRAALGREAESLRENVRLFEKKTGMLLPHWIGDHEDFVRAVKFVRESGADRIGASVAKSREKLKRIVDVIDESGLIQKD